MKLQFLGTGAAEGAPAVFCQCSTCRELRRRGEKEYHTRAQYLLDGCLGIDFPPDAYYHSLRFGVDLSKLKHLIITHSHMDHFYAHDFILRGYKYADVEDMPMTIYGNEETLKVFEECMRRELKEGVAKNFTLARVFPFQPFFCGEQGEYLVTPLPAQHSAVEEAFVYLIEKGGKAYLHLTDTGRLPLATLDYLEKYFEKRGGAVDFVTFDCTFLFHTAGEISRHMGLGDNRAMQEEFFRRKIVNEGSRYAITHYSHNSAPLLENLTRAQNEYGYIPAYDGMQIEI